MGKQGDISFSQRFHCYFCCSVAVCPADVVVPPEGSGRLVIFGCCAWMVLLFRSVLYCSVVSLLCCIKQMRIVAVSYYPLAAALCGSHHVTISRGIRRSAGEYGEYVGNHGNNAPPWPERVFFWLWLWLLGAASCEPA